MDQHQNESRKLYERVNFRALFSFAVLIGLWSILTYGGFVDPLFLPSPGGVAEAAIRLFSSGFWGDIGISLYRITIGFLVGAVFAIPLGILIGVSERVRAFFEPVVGFLRYLPASAFIPLAILWLGVGEIQKMFIIFVGTFPYLALLVAGVVIDTDKHLINFARSLGASEGTVVRKVIIPASLPGIWDALRVMAGIGWTYIIVAELVAARSGIGHVIIEAQRYLLTANIITGLIVIGILGILTDFMFQYGRKKLFPYLTQ